MKISEVRSDLQSFVVSVEEWIQKEFPTERDYQNYTVDDFLEGIEMRAQEDEDIKEKAVALAAYAFLMNVKEKP